jgi:LDH2 family malate/lactate/ureidoglycolate dehydrogenase
VDQRFPAPVLEEFVERVMGAGGLPDADARTVARLMVEADVTGADGHGVIRLAHYVARIQGGAVNTRPNVTVSRTGPATAMVDGDNGMGHVVMSAAGDTAAELAAEAGFGWVGVRGSNHAGPGALYAMMPLQHDMIGIYGAVASANHMPPWGSSEKLLGTNPLAVAIPSGTEPPVVLDMATTVVSYGTIKKFALRGEPLPAGWVVGLDGEPITDAEHAHDGFLLPIGGYKGSGLAIVIGLLAGVLNGAAFGRDVVDFTTDVSTQTNTGHFMAALDIGRFTPVADFKAEVDRHVRDIRAAERLPGVEAIRLPGELRQSRYADRAAGGVPLSAALLRQLDDVARDVGVPPLERPAPA